MQDDMIPRLRHVDAESVEDAIDVLEEHGRDATVIAGNTDEVEWMKNRTRAPTVVVDIKPIEELHGIEERDDGGLTIGALTLVTDVADSDLVNDHFRVLAASAADVATPQIRNQGSVGGNLAQDSRCWYYREGFDCYRAGGNTCYAITDDSREHAVTDYSRCITAHPSDMAPALVALEAEVTIAGPGGTRTEALEGFFVGPETNITVMNDLAHNEILTEIVVPDTWRDATFYWEKARDREAWDFPLVNIAAALRTSGNSVSDVRVVSNGVAPTPKRLRSVERSIQGSSLSEANVESAANAALPNADPFPDNQYKIPLTRNLVRNALSSAM